MGPHGLTLEISNTWDRRFVSDVCHHVRNGKAISTAQGELALKMIERYRDHLEAHGTNTDELLALLLEPAYRIPPHVSTVMPREVRWLGNNKLAFRCKYNPIIIEDIKKLKGTNHFQEDSYPLFKRDWKIWIVDVNSGNYNRTMEVIRRHRFEFDSSVEMFFLNCELAQEEATDVQVDEESIVVNVRNDDFLNAWLNDLIALESANV